LRMNLLPWITSNAVPAGMFTPYKIYAALDPLVTLALTTTDPKVLLVKISEVMRAKFLSESGVVPGVLGTVRMRFASELSMFVGDLNTLVETLAGRKICDMVLS